jgi:hypothetical protein
MMLIWSARTTSLTGLPEGFQDPARFFLDIPLSWADYWRGALASTIVLPACRLWAKSVVSLHGSQAL